MSQPQELIQLDPIFIFQKIQTCNNRFSVFQIKILMSCNGWIRQMFSFNGSRTFTLSSIELSSKNDQMDSVRSIFSLKQIWYQFQSKILQCEFISFNYQILQFKLLFRMFVGGLPRIFFRNIMVGKQTFCYTPSIKFTHGSEGTCTKAQPKVEQPATQTAPEAKKETNKKMTNRDALNSAMEEELRRDDKVFLMGEEVAYYHGAYKISKGLIDKFGPGRIWDTPITEAGFTGLGVGAALMGLRPIIEFMTMNFALQGIDHIINSMAKTHYMSSGILSGSIVFRGLNGPAAAVAAQHSQCFASWFGSVPGLVTISPYDAEDCRGLLKSAIRGNNPVVFLQNQYLYGQAFDVTEEVLSPEFLIPIGKAKIMRPGKHVTIVGYARNVKFALQAAEELAKEGIEAQVINLRSIKPLDRTTIVNSIKKTHRIVTVEDGFPQSGIGAEIAGVVFECCFDELDAPLERITALDIPMPYAKNLEELTTPNASHIIKAVKKTLKGVRL